MADIDTSSYPTRQAPAFSPLQAAGEYTNIQNALTHNQIMQQQIPQQQVEAQIARGKIKAGQIIAKHSQDGQTDWLGVGHDMYQDPDTAMEPVSRSVQDLINNQLSQTPAGLGPNNAPRNASLQTVNASLGRQQLPAAGGNALTNAAPAQGGNALTAGAPNQMQGPLPDQQTIDGLHAHNQAMISTLTPLANDPSVDHKKVIRAVADLVAHPDAQFNGVDGASALTQLFGQNGQPLPSNEIQPRIQSLLDQQKQNEAALQSKFPSSEQLKSAQQPAAPQGQPAVNPQQAQSNDPLDNAPTLKTGLPAGYSENQKAQQEHYQGVQKDADAVKVQNAALQNVLNISKSGVDTGTKLSKVYDALAKSGLATAGITDAASQRQQIAQHLEQIATAGGMPGSDARLSALQNANIGPDQLAETIQKMAPYLIGINSSKLAQAKYYHGVDPSGTDPDKISTARLKWQENADPRAFEYEAMSPSEKADYAKGLDPKDAVELAQKRKTLQQLGAFK